MSKSGFWKKWSLLPFAVVGQYNSYETDFLFAKEVEAPKATLGILF